MGGEPILQFGVDTVDEVEPGATVNVAPIFGRDDVADDFGLDAATAEQLELKPGDPVLIFSQTGYDQLGRAFELAKTVYRADRYVFRGTLVAEGVIQESPAGFTGSIEMHGTAGLGCKREWPTKACEAGKNFHAGQRRFSEPTAVPLRYFAATIDTAPVGSVPVIAVAKLSRAPAVVVPIVKTCISGFPPEHATAMYVFVVSSARETGLLPVANGEPLIGVNAPVEDRRNPLMLFAVLFATYT